MMESYQQRRASTADTEALEKSWGSRNWVGSWEPDSISKLSLIFGDEPPYVEYAIDCFELEGFLLDSKLRII